MNLGSYIVVDYVRLNYSTPVNLFYEQVPHVNYQFFKYLP